MEYNYKLSFSSLLTLKVFVIHRTKVGEGLVKPITCTADRVVLQSTYHAHSW